MGGGGPDIPDPISAGENYRDTIEAQIENQGLVRELQLLNKTGDVEILRRIAPLLAEVQMDFEERYGSQLRAQASEAQAQTVAGDAFNVSELSPMVNEAIAAADPRAEALRAQLHDSVSTDLAAGAGLDDSLRREIQQGIRSGQSARGITRGAAPVSEEAFAQGSAGVNLRNMRRQAAESFLRTNAATRPDTLSFITQGRASGGNGAGGGGGVAQMPMSTGGGGGGFNNQLMQQFTQQSNMNHQLQSNAAMAGAPGGVSGGIGGGLSGAASGAMVGSVVPGIGTAIGAGIGGVLGMIGGAL